MKGSFEERLAKAETAAEAPQGFRSFVVDREVPESTSITSFYLVPEDAQPLAEFCRDSFSPSP